METKVCTKCDVEYPITEEYFVLDNRSKNGLGAQCKKCDNARSQNWREKNSEKQKEYYQKNKEKRNGESKKWRQEHREDALNYQRLYTKTLRGYINYLVSAIRQRCNNPKIHNYKNYGGRGVKCLFDSVKLFTWVVVNNIDPRGLQIHRINNDGNYTLDNIEFLDKSIHAKLHNPKGIKIGSKGDKNVQ